MNIHGGDHRVQRSISGRAAQPGQARAMPPQPYFGETLGFLVVIGDEHGARGEDAGLAALGQRLHVSVIIGFWILASDRSGALAGRGCVRDSMRPSPAAPARLAPSTVNVACQTRSTKLGFAGYS